MVFWCGSGDSLKLPHSSRDGCKVIGGNSRLTSVKAVFTAIQNEVIAMEVASSKSVEE